MMKDYDALFFNRDYEPYARERDDYVSKQLKAKQIFTYKDHLIFEPHEVLKKDGTFFKVFTPYKNEWIKNISNNSIKQLTPNINNFHKFKNTDSIINKDWYSTLGFIPQDNIIIAKEEIALKKLKDFDIEQYKETRDFPAKNGTSNLSAYIRFGLISPRALLKKALKHNTASSDVWLSELIWREFYQAILFFNPQVQKQCFNQKYENIPWDTNEELFSKWRDGKTGFPIIDAAQRCLNQTGTMPNRLRMVSASFLCKTLLLDWKKGEAHFASKLLDFDLAANSGGWQWCAGVGTDAQPYFRIFNPFSQSEKFDANGDFIRKYCPELKSLSNKEIHNPSQEQKEKLGYPQEVVNYKENRIKAINLYKIILNA